MKQVHQHPDGMVFVRVDDATYADTADNFAIDFGFMLPELPEGMVERIYDQNRSHVLAGVTMLVLSRWAAKCRGRWAIRPSSTLKPV